MKRRLAAVSILSLSFLAPGALAAPAFIPPALQARFSQAQDLVKSAQVNLKLASDAAGPDSGPVAGAKAKLALLRLNQAGADALAAAQVLDALPAQDPDVLALRAELTKAELEIGVLRARLDAAPAAPVAPGLKLDYQQVEALKGARAHLDEVEGNLRALDEINAQFKEFADPDTFDHRRAADAIATIANAKRKSDFAAVTLDKLPPAGQGVPEERARLGAARSSLAAADAVFAPLHQRLQTLIDPRTYPNLADDLKRLIGLARMFDDQFVFDARPARAATLFVQLAPARAEVDRIGAAYRALRLQQTTEGKEVQSRIGYFASTSGAFAAFADAARKALPGAISTDIKQINAMADQAVADQNPLWFPGGIADRVERLRQRVALLEVLDPAAAPAVRSEVEAHARALAEREQALGESIIQQNPVPPDRYRARDRDELIKRAADAWKAVQPGAVILATVIPGERWERDTVWRFENRAWRLIDRSQLQAQLLVKHDERLAVIRPVNLWIDHADNDAPSAIPLGGSDDPLPPARFVLLAKVMK